MTIIGLVALHVDSIDHVDHTACDAEICHVLGRLGLLTSGCHHHLLFRLLLLLRVLWRSFNSPSCCRSPSSCQKSNNVGIIFLDRRRLLFPILIRRCRRRHGGTHRRSSATLVALEIFRVHCRRLVEAFPAFLRGAAAARSAAKHLPATLEAFYRRSHDVLQLRVVYEVLLHSQPQRHHGSRSLMISWICISRTIDRTIRASQLGGCSYNISSSRRIQKVVREVQLLQRPSAKGEVVRHCSAFLQLVVVHHQHSRGNIPRC
mmetsp:Transcript_69505/g.110168  ORF Transcript_69505/g.110168 Transcript_69505/m.110168 type:complete len:261 (+) Transcript_69505:1857-2639(+)